jgi:hypothetical protein
MCIERFYGLDQHDRQKDLLLKKAMAKPQRLVKIHRLRRYKTQRLAGPGKPLLLKGLGFLPHIIGE